MFNSQVQKKASDANLRHHRKTLLFKHKADRVLKVICRLIASLVWSIQYASLSKCQISLQSAQSPCASCVGMDSIWVERAKYFEPSFCARKENIQTTMPIRAVDRSKPLIEITIGIRSICDRNENYVTLIALHILQILDEEWLSTIVHRSEE